MQEIQWQDFEKVELRVGTIVQAEEFPEALRPAFKLQIDFGQEIGVLQSSAQITDHYTIEALAGKQVVAVVNLRDKQIGPFISQCLTTGFYDDAHQVVLVSPDRQVPNGAKLG